MLTLRFTVAFWLCWALFTGLVYAGAAAKEAKLRDPRAVTHPISLPVSQILTPAGEQIILPGLRPQALALSPDRKLLVTSGKTHDLLVLDAVTGRIRQTVALPAVRRNRESATVSDRILYPDKDAQLSFTGLIFSPDGRRIYLSDVMGTIKVFAVTAEGTVFSTNSFDLPAVSGLERTNEIPAGLALSPDGHRLYVCLNLSNQLLEADAHTGRPLRTFAVGVAPLDVIVSGDRAYVSNWGGRRPDATSVTGPAGRGTLVRVDPFRFIANEGSVSVIDLRGGTAVSEILTGLHSAALALSPDGRHLVVANAGSDTLSVMDTRDQKVIETISLKWQPNDYFGATPNALVFDRSGRTLFVGHGTQNAVAVVSFRPRKSALTGLIPVGWFPGAIVLDAARDRLWVANIKGIGSGRRTEARGDTYNSHQHNGSLSLVRVPTRRELVQMTRTALHNCRREMIERSQLPSRPNQPPRPVPERVGEPSVFKHVVYVIKENRTYDQVLGDMPQGRGDPALCIFGEAITPNLHKLAREFVLLDHIYCSGILSADGHQWATTAITTDYLERSFAGFPRSYPDGMGDDEVDALAYAPTGFIWDNALERGKTFRDYGEFAISDIGWAVPGRRGKPGFIDFYRDFIEDTHLTRFSCRPAIESLRPYLNTNTVGWAMEVPDVVRAAQFIKELKQFEASGKMPELIIICLPNDHTSGTQAGAPTPSAHVADNDLAFGRIVEAISHSRFWRDTCIFAIEDDPQDGWDHVSAYRTTGFVVSPYTRRNVTVSTEYNQPGMLRTIELILGLPPMNAMDAAATPMSDCFTNVPDFTPYQSVPNRVPLDQLNPRPEAIKDPVQRRYAQLAARLPLDRIDQCPEDLLNRMLWHAQKGGRVPYPRHATRQFQRRRD